MSWTYTNPDNNEQIEVFSTDDGEQAIHAPRSADDAQPYCDEGNTGRRYRPDQVR
jgi:hypothetical protein